MTAQCKIAREWAPWRNSLEGTENGQSWHAGLGLEVSGTAADLVALAVRVESGDLADVMRDRPALPPAVAKDFASALRKVVRLGVSRSGSSQEEVAGNAYGVSGRVEVGLSWAIAVEPAAVTAPADKPIRVTSPAPAL